MNLNVFVQYLVNNEIAHIWQHPSYDLELGYILKQASNEQHISYFVATTL